MKTLEIYFKWGADAMQGRIVAMLMANNQFDLAAKVLALQTPPYSEPETFEIKEQSK